MGCCTTVDRREVYERWGGEAGGPNSEKDAEERAIAELFVQHGLMWAVVEDKAYAHQNSGASRFQPTKNAIYGVTEKGQRLAGWLRGDRESPNGDARGCES